MGFKKKLCRKIIQIYQKKCFVSPPDQLVPDVDPQRGQVRDGDEERQLVPARFLAGQEPGQGFNWKKYSIAA